MPRMWKEGKMLPSVLRKGREEVPIERGRSDAVDACEEMTVDVWDFQYRRKRAKILSE